ncbi:MAG TPA: hypothetical protein VEL28_06200 [Candidatus Binatia bacterium]|nr:hypothetical protein [Candidatus Binatia bacterium]
MSCDTYGYYFSLASAGTDFYMAWYATTGWESFIYGHGIAGTGGLGPFFTHATGQDYGQCRSTVYGPVRAVPVRQSVYHVQWYAGDGCWGTPWFERIDSAAAWLDGAEQDSRTWYPPPLDSGFDGADEDAFAAWFYSQTSIAGRWAIGGQNVAVSTRTPSSVGSAPSVAAANGSVVVVWSQEHTVAGVDTQIRATRVTRDLGRLEPDGGMLVANVPSGITSSPVATFDGSRWLAAWTELAAATQTNDLRVVSIGTDGTLGSPVVIAEDVAAGSMRIASTRDGRALVAFARRHDDLYGIRSMLVDPSIVP